MSCRNFLPELFSRLVELFHLILKRFVRKSEMDCEMDGSRIDLIFGPFWSKEDFFGGKATGDPRKVFVYQIIAWMLPAFP